MTAEKIMQCKDIPTQPILDFLARMFRYPTPEPEPTDLMVRSKWASHLECWPENERVPFPEGTPPYLRLVKMRNLTHKGLVDGCDCGCRGDWVITDKGLCRLEAMNTEYMKERR